MAGDLTKICGATFTSNRRIFFKKIKHTLLLVQNSEIATMLDVPSDLLPSVDQLFCERLVADFVHSQLRTYCLRPRPLVDSEFDEAFSP